MAKPIALKPGAGREDTHEELLAAQKAAQKAANKAVKNHDFGAAGRALLEDQESFLPGVTDRHVGAGRR
ncbi:MAG TPA: hypothetical protein VGR97_08200 [Candidatus Acidoferrales bacterium]|nr:hypothetical protein [Candidatus Acidoferrales bacterium]